MCVNCNVLPHTVNLFPGLSCVSIVICYHTLSTRFWFCMCDVLPHTVDLFPGLVYASIVMCYHTLLTCFRVLYVCQLSCVTTHFGPVSRSCICVSCDVISHTVDLFPGIVCVSIAMCYHTLSTCFQVFYVCQL